MRIVLMGMPGVGKGTQAVQLRDHLAVAHVSTGDILREAVKAGSDLGRQVKGVLEAGALVPDQLMGNLIGERLRQEDAREGFILDGFPRTVDQVAILDGVLERLGVALDAAILLEAPEELVVERLSGRRVCPKCGAVYHVAARPPKSAGTCDGCGTALVQRPDDTEKVIRDRLDVYRKQTHPIAEAYESRGLLRRFDGTGTPQAIFERLKTGLEQA